VLGLVAHSLDVTVGEVPHGPVHVPQAGRAQAHRLYRSGGGAGVDHVAHAVLVLRQHEDARNEVPHQVLGAEADGDADDPRARDEGSEVEPQLAQDHEAGDGPDGEAADAAEEGGDGVGPAAPAETGGDGRRVGGGDGRRLALDAGDQPLDDPTEDTTGDEGHQQDDEDPRRPHDQRLRPLGQHRVAGGPEHAQAERAGVGRRSARPGGGVGGDFGQLAGKCDHGHGKAR
jgi:hypothetical protein